MKFFPPEFDSFSDRKREKVRAAYRQHMDRVIPKLPATVRVLASANLHDGLIRLVSVERLRGRLGITMRCGDLLVGYYDLGLVYHEFALTADGLVQLREVARDRNAEVYCDEIDAESSGRWVHRMLFWTKEGVYREVSIEFSHLTIRFEPRKNREFKRDQRPFRIVR